MAMVTAVAREDMSSALTVGLVVISVGLVRVSAATWSCSSFIRVNRVNSCDDYHDDSSINIVLITTASTTVSTTNYYYYYYYQWRQEGGGQRAASAPGGTVQGTAFGGAKIWNTE